MKPSLHFALALAAALALVTAVAMPCQDAMIFYHAGLHHLRGDRLYSDFYVSHGPLAGWLFSLFLRTTPSGGTALGVASAVLNVVATGLAWRIVRDATGSDRRAGEAAMLTAVWFLPPFGAYYNDHLAFVALLGSAALLVRAGSAWWLTLAGALVALSFHAKQTVGLVGLVAVLVAYGGEFIRRPRGWAFFAGTLAGHVAVFSVLAATVSLSRYYEYTFLYPWSELTSSHATKHPLGLLWTLLFPYRVVPFFPTFWRSLGQLSFYSVIICVYAAYVTLIAGWRARHVQGWVRPLTFMVFCCVGCSGLLGRLYAHLFLGMGVVVPIVLHGARRARWGNLVVGILVLLGLATAAELHRDLWAGAPRVLRASDLRPIRVRASPVTLAIEKIVARLRNDSSDYAILGNGALWLPLALGRAPVSPQVVSDGYTIPRDEVLRQGWEVDFIACLERRRPKYLVLGLGSDYGEVSARARATFPALRAYVEHHFFSVTDEAGITLLQRREESS